MSVITTANQVYVSPETAKEWLNRSGGNRTLKRASVISLKEQIMSGQWRYNGDRIRFLSDGTLYDGHHRLTACVEAGVPIVTDVFIMPDDAKSTVDKGVSRSAADCFVMESLVPAKYARHIASAIRLIVKHEQTDLLDWGNAPGNNSKALLLLTQQSMDAFLSANYENLIRAATWACKEVRSQNALISKGQATAFLFLAAKHHSWEDGIDFCNKVILGTNVDHNSPQMYLRNLLISSRLRQRKMLQQHRLYSFVKTFNSVVRGRPIKHATNVSYRTQDKPPRIRPING